MVSGAENTQHVTLLTHTVNSFKQKHVKYNPRRDRERGHASWETALQDSLILLPKVLQIATGALKLENHSATAW